MEVFLRSHPNTSASLQYLAESHRERIDSRCLDDVTDLDHRYGLSLGYNPNRSQTITCLWVTPYGRFGNLLIQIGHALDVAKFLSVSRIFFDPKVQETNIFQESRTVLVDGIELNASTFAKPSIFDVTLYGTFWSLHHLAPEHQPVEPRDLVPSRHLADLLSDHVRKPLSSSVKIVAHFRGGDIFRKNIEYPNYNQPPLAFYIEAIRAARNCSDDIVHVVYEDMMNPVVLLLLEWLKMHDIPFVAQSSDLKDDLRTLLGAHTLVASFGTFVPAVMKLSSNLKRVFSFDNPEVLNVWSRFRKDLELIEYFDLAGEFARRGEWKATDEQIEQLKSYPAEKISAIIRSSP